MKILILAGSLVLALFTADLRLADTKDLASQELLLARVSEINNKTLRHKLSHFLQNYPFMNRSENYSQPADPSFKGFGLSFIDRQVMTLLGVKPAKRHRTSNRVQYITNHKQEYHLNYECKCTCETICNIPKCPKVRNGFFKCKYPNCGDRCDLQLEFGDYEYTTTPDNRTVIPVEFVTPKPTPKSIYSIPSSSLVGHLIKYLTSPKPEKGKNRMLTGKITKRLESPYKGVGYLMAAIKQMTTNDTLQNDILALLQPDIERLDKFDQHLIGDMRYILKHFKDKMPPHLPRAGVGGLKWERNVKKHLGSVITASYAVFGHILAETQPSRLREKRGTNGKDIKADGGGPKPCVCDIKCEVSAENCIKRCPTEPRCPPGKCVCRE